MSNPHALLRRQVHAFHLAGTVALPSPFPEVGTLWLIPGGLEYEGVKGEAACQDLVAIEHVQTNRVTVTRLVLLEDVTAVVFFPGHHHHERWYFGPEIAGELEARSGHDAGCTSTGIAYVREAAPVLMKVEVAMTAAESAEYYPPVIGERTDAHYVTKGEYCCNGGCDRAPYHPMQKVGPCNGGCEIPPQKKGGPAPLKKVGPGDGGSERKYR